MALWKRLTMPNGVEVDVNLDLILYMGRDKDVTTLFFVGGPNDTGKNRTINVKETPDEICLQSALRMIASVRR